MKLDKRFIIIFIILVTEVLGFSLVLPFLPFMAQDLGASPFQVGLILSVFSVFQFVSAPIMGKLSDSYGRRPLLLFSQLSTFIGFIILGFSKSLWMIILSRIVDGLLGSNFSIAQAYLSDISSKKNRSKTFGLSGAAFGFGFMIGPAIGGLLSRFGYGLPSFVAALMALITILTTFFFLPETIKRKRKMNLKIEILKFSDFKSYLLDSKVAGKLRLFFSYVLSHAIWVSSFAMFAERQLGFNAVQVGYLLTFIGLVSIILRGFLLGKIIDLIGERNSQITGLAMVVLSMLGVSFAKDFYSALFFIGFFALGSGLLRPLLMASISKSVSPKKQGEVMGFTNSLGSLSQIIGPLLGGYLIANFFPGSLGLAAGLVMIIGILTTLKGKKISLSGKINPR
ncbi:hypothetical protein COT75_00785 [Candidatus Beckwithbacteria bacterium CG10_big_fil_rev_8_21_14_0_10_34_10]|uniref:Major facilitator superfamily (MFS) profile domain-containing protein n=1 Tax=Candidatus Beckwithbacteria bacterium CG10_big_fil_rev_8_21_14_0_10_34_10 TaxID=1974495 RepID=A0A2H0WCS6_9BACT|nr:MAG: hypothetical protein COT75_00785 [Candidatus Beckwithbacteria bacterium CG10_big_fil_rev_8_21_14_0_10_34_10]